VRPPALPKPFKPTLPKKQEEKIKVKVNKDMLDSNPVSMKSAISNVNKMVQQSSLTAQSV